MWKKTLVWTALVLASLMAILLVMTAVSFYITGRRLNARLKEIRAAGDPICIADLAPAPIPADQNAANLLQGIQDDLKAFTSEVNEYYKSENYQTGRPSESQLKTIEAALAAYPEIIPTVRRAVALKGYQRGLDYSLPVEQFAAASIDQTGGTRGIARALSLQAAVQRSHGKWDEATDSAITMLRLARLSEQECTLCIFLVSLAIRSMGVDAANLALRGGPVSDASRARLDAELAQADPFPGYLKALKFERAYGLDSFNSFPVRIVWNGQKLDYLDALAEEIRLASESYTTYCNSPKSTSRSPLVGTVIPALDAARDATERVRARIRALRVLNAILGRDDPDAPTPTDLTEFGLLKNAAIDPFTGKPLIVTRPPEGWKVYSVGRDLTDDGGKLDGISDIGVGPIEEDTETE